MAAGFYEELRVVVHAPTGRDAAIACEILAEAGVPSQAAPDLETLYRFLNEGLGALVLAEEAINPRSLERLSELLAGQPAWSDLPIIVFAANDTQASRDRVHEMLEALGNVTVIERPVRIATLLSTLRSALRARKRQYLSRATLHTLESKEEALTLAGQRKDEFLATLAHELRNPMAAIGMALNLLEVTDCDSAKATRYRQTARRQMSNLVRLVDDLLDVSRITRGTVELRKERFDFAVVVNHAVTAIRPAVEGRRHELTVTTTDGPFPMEADPTRLEQVVCNLLTNSAKYTEPGGKISIRLSRDPNAKVPTALLCVKDSGRGIPPEMLEQVFELFVQVNQTIDRTLGGLGLGLTLVKRLVEMHGGKVCAASGGDGQGSVFSVRLPLDTSNAPADELPLEQLETKSLEERQRIVVVEDSDDVRQTMTEFLEELGHEVAIATNGLDGVKQLLALQPDVALVDVGLPGIDGYEVARRVRADRRGRGLLLVALTGYGGPDAKEKALSAGFDLHLTKPIDITRLPQVLRRRRGSE